MTSLTAKVCIVGDFAVGKTSTVERFVNQQYSDKYLTTVGVKIDTREVRVDEYDCDLKLVLWDVAGTERFGALEFSYLRGAAGILLVADGTRARTAQSALQLKAQIDAHHGALPVVFLMNKSDLRPTWEVDEHRLQHISEECPDLFCTSALSGNNVDDAIRLLATRIAAAELG